MSKIYRNKKITGIRNLFKNSRMNTKVKLFFSRKTFGDFYDDFEDNATYVKLNPVTIKAYVMEITPSSLVFRRYGMEDAGAKEILADIKYKKWFTDCEKIEIDGEEYQVFKEAAGQNMIITERAFNTLRVVVTRRTQ